MGLVVNPLKAFRVCHGYKIDHELILWSPGVIGILSDAEEFLCKKIIIENAKGGPKVFFSVAEALEAETEPPKEKVGHIVAIRTCAHLLDEAEDIGLITGRRDVWAFMDYCMAKLGYGKVDREIPDHIKMFIDRMLEKEEMKGAMKKLEKAKSLEEEFERPKTSALVEMLEKPKALATV